MQINIEVFYKFILSFWVCVPKVPKIKSSHIFAISPERCGDEVDRLPADKHRKFLQVDSVAVGVRLQACSKHPK